MMRGVRRGCDTASEVSGVPREVSEGRVVAAEASQAFSVALLDTGAVYTWCVMCVESVQHMQHVRQVGRGCDVWRGSPSVCTVQHVRARRYEHTYTALGTKQQRHA